jgi:hypothetical protein
MSTITYGGDPSAAQGDAAAEGITLELSNIDRFEEEVLYDASGTDYECTHITLECTCVFNPAATAYLVGGQGGLQGAGSVAKLRHQLLQARKKLIVKVGPDVLLESPAGRDTVDVRVGPKPLYLNPVSFHGTKSVVCSFAIETWINECESRNVLLSNRWRTRHVIDDLEMTTRVITGRAVFNQAVMAAGGVTPDDFRSSFRFRVPDVAGLPGASFQRVGADWQLVEDNTAVEYAITDQEQLWGLGQQCPARRVDGSFRVQDKLYYLGGGLIDALTYFCEANVEVWGNPGFNREELADFGVKLVLNRLRFGLGDPVAPVIVSSAVEFGLRKNYVKVSALTRGLRTDVANFDVGVDIPYRGRVRTDKDYGGDIPFRATDNPGWADRGNRGNYLNKMMAAALLGECGAPCQPPVDVPSARRDATCGVPGAAGPSGGPTLGIGTKTSG